MIEVASDEYHITCTYAEALFYCFALNIDGKTGWRLPDEDEYYIYLEYTEDEELPISPWFTDDKCLLLTDNFICVPVRDIIYE